MSCCTAGGEFEKCCQKDKSKSRQRAGTIAQQGTASSARLLLCSALPPVSLARRSLCLSPGARAHPPRSPSPGCLAQRIPSWLLSLTLLPCWPPPSAGHLQIGNYLRSQGVGKGDEVAIYM